VTTLKRTITRSNAIPYSLPVHPQVEYADIIEEYIRPGIDWLDIGCGRQIVPDWVWGPERAQHILRGVNITGLDRDEAISEHPYLKTCLKCFAESIPVPDENYDLVTANMVMEHVQEPARVLCEIRRVLRPGGWFIVHTPNRRYYLIAAARWLHQHLKNVLICALESRSETDVFPTHYRFNTPEVIRCVAEQTGFVVKSIRLTGPYPAFWTTHFAHLERPILALLQRPAFERYRSNLIVKLQKPLGGPCATQSPSTKDELL